jgi:hypothetical protein
MDGKNALVLVLVAVVAILAKGSVDGLGSAGAPKATGSAASPTPESAAGTKAKAGPAKPAPAGAPAPCPDDDPACQVAADFPGVFAADPAKERPPLHLLVASVPSPREPVLDLDFDRSLEAIERAVQSQRYVLQRQWLPWRADVTGRSGWLLFRRDAHLSVDLLLVLVVSERPSSGVEPAELDWALDRFADIVAKQGPPPPKPKANPAETAEPTPLLLLGPYYSGTAQSLVQQTRAWCGQKAAFCAARDLVTLSGTATRRRTQPILRSLGAVFRSSSFYATVLPDDLLVAGMHRFIEERLQVPAKEIADLTETSTDYGNAVATEDPARDGADEASLKIALPLNVGRLAEATPDAKGELPEPARSTGVELDTTFATLSRNGINHVGILATATRDKVFLAGRLRASAPDLRVHMYEGSVDLADRHKREALEGLMVASSYPVSAATQIWTRREKGSLLQFQSAAAEGIYNAALGLLSRFDGALARSLSRQLLDYTPLFCDRRTAAPSVWVSASISGQLWPLAVYAPALAVDGNVRDCSRPVSDEYLFGPQVPYEPPQLKPLPVRASFLTLIGVVCVLVLIVGNGIGFLPLRAGSGWRLPLVSYDPNAPPGHSPLPADGSRHNVAMLGLWALALTGVVMGKVLDLPLSIGAPAEHDHLLHALATLLIGSSLVLVLTAYLISAHREAQHSTEQRRMSISIQLGMCVLMLLAISFCPFDELVKHPDGHAYFFFVRAVDLSIGLTPTIPLFMVGVTIYCASLLRILVLRRARRLADEARLWNPVPRRSLRTCARTMAKFAAASSRSLLPACTAGTALGFVVLYWTPMRLGSFEGRGFDAGCSICFSLAFTVTLAATWRAHALWYRLRDFTRSVAIHPAAAALTRLPGSVAQRFRSPVPGQVGNQQIDVALTMTLHAMGEVAAPTIATVVEQLDKLWFPLGVLAKTPPAATGSLPDAPASPQRKRTLEQLQEDFLALHMANALGLMCDATRTMLFIATGTGLAALLGCALYPFQPAATLTGAGLVSVGLVVIVALRVLLGIEKDQVLSDVAQTTPGKITPSLGLFARLLGYVIVPLGGLIGSRLQDQGTIIDLLKSLTNALNR